MDDNTQAILLLACHFPGVKTPEHAPLTATEYGRFASWMRDSGWQPHNLFTNSDAMLKEWLDPKGKISAARVQYLLERGVALALATEKWTGAGIQIITRSDTTYPARLKQRLGQASPPILFTVGAAGLMDKGGLAVVGSRSISSDDESNAKSLGKQAALEGMSVISGGAKGADETATLAALEIEGTAVAVLANDLFKASINRKWQSYLRAGQLALISAVSPETAFQVGNAMGRNKYIYSLSDYAVVVRSDKDSGGTWAGATENLRSNNRWVPIFVPAAPSSEGNSALIDKGARSIDIPQESSAAPADWLLGQLTGYVAEGNGIESQESFGAGHGASQLMAPSRAETPDLEDQIKEGRTVSDSFNGAPDGKDEYEDFLRFVLGIIETKGEVSLSDLLSLRPEKPKTRVRKWVDQAVESGEILRPGRPLRYTLPSRKNVTADLFSDMT